MSEKFINVIRANQHIAEQDTRIATLTDENKKLTEANDQLSKENATLLADKEKLAVVEGEKAKLAADLEAEKKALTDAEATHKAELAKAIEDGKSAGSTQARQILAKVGIKAVPQNPNETPATPAKSTLEKFAEAKGVEKARLWKTHKAEIMSAAGE